MEAVVIGEGTKIIKQYPEENTKLNAHNKIFLLTNDTNYKMINIKGWSRSDVSTFARMVNLDVSFDGYGYVKTYSIKEGTLLDKSSKLDVTLEPVFKEETKKDNQN